MSEEKIKVMTDCLFTLVKALNTTLDRLDALTDRIQALYEQHHVLIANNQQAFIMAREDFFRRLITAEVEKEIEKNKLKDRTERKQTDDANRNRTSRKISFTINSRCQGSNEEVAPVKR